MSSEEYLLSMSFYEHAVYPVMQNEHNEVDEYQALQLVIVHHMSFSMHGILKGVIRLLCKCVTLKDQKYPLTFCPLFITDIVNFLSFILFCHTCQGNPIYLHKVKI